MDELLKKAKRNDEEAFNELILLVQKDLYIIAKTKLQDDNDVADAIQETIISCYQNIRKLRNNKFFKTWLIKILINECNKIYIKRKRYNTSYDEEEFSKKLIFEENFLKNMNFENLIKDLKDDEKLILTLYYYEDYSTKEISKILKINENTIRSKLARAKSKLKNQYEGGYYE